MDDRRRRFEAQALPHLDAAYNLARWLARSQTDAEDIVQDAMLRAWRGFDTWRGGDMKPWLLTIVRNCCRTAGRASRQHMPLPEDEHGGLPSEDTGPEEAAMESSDSQRLNRTVALLPEEFREVLILREVEDLSYSEIAEVAGIPIGTVMSRLARARTMLKQRWMAEERP